MKSCPLCFHNNSRPKYNVEGYRIFQCRECGFVYLDQNLDERQEQSTYEHYFQHTSLDDYSESSDDPHIQQAHLINQRRLQWVQNSHKSGRLLDVGCGRGFFLKHALDADFEAEGIELSHSAAQYATEHFDVEVHVANLEQEKSLQQEYDVITMWHVLEHFYQPVHVLQNVWNLLAPGGTLFIEVPNLNSAKFRLLPPSRRWQGGNHPQFHRCFFTHTTLERALRQAGFKNVRNKFITYPVPNNPLLRRVKQVLNRFYLDSFLQIQAE